MRGTVNIAFIDNDSTHDTICIMVDVRYGRLTVPILESNVRAGPFHLNFLIRHRSTQRLDSICTIRDTDNVIMSDPSSLRYYTETSILSAAIVIATLLRNALILIGVALDNKHYDARTRYHAKPGTKQERP